MSTRKYATKYKYLGQNIRRLRKSLSLNQQSFSKELSTSAGYISEIESNKKIPGSDFLMRLKDRFQISIDSLFENQELENDSETSEPATQAEGIVRKLEGTDKDREALLLQIIESKIETIVEKDKRIEMLEEQLEKFKRELDRKEKDETSA